MSVFLGVLNVVLAVVLGPVNHVFGGDPDWVIVLFGLIIGIWLLDGNK